MKTNVKTEKPKKFTHGGAFASNNTSAEQDLKRSVMACMLWEDTFYESGVEIAKRISDLVAKVHPSKVAQIAIDARSKQNLRHVPLLLVRAMAKLDTHKEYVADTLFQVIQRADEISEFLAIYWKDGKCPISAQVKKGLARSFKKFNEYSFAKYNRDGDVKLRDVMFLCHPKWDGGSTPFTEISKKSKNKTWKLKRHEDSLYQKIADNTLKTPDTWEVELSAGKDKKETFTRLMEEGKLGALAFIRNLRNMQQSGVDKRDVLQYSQTVDLKRVLPFRFVAAAKACPQWEDVCDSMLIRGTKDQPKLTGKTVVIVDVSGSMMHGNISAKSDMTRLEGAGALAAILREVCEDARIYATAGNDSSRIHATTVVPNRHGMALVEKFTNPADFHKSIGGGGIFLTQCMNYVKNLEKEADRIIVLTDEQDCDTKANPALADAFGKNNYIINVSCNKNGVGYGKWTKIDGWSESVISYIRESESDNQ